MRETPPAFVAASVTIVTYNSERFIRRCLQHLIDSEAAWFPIVVVDNASSDKTTAILDEFAGRIEVTRNSVNNGFAGGQNQAISQTNSPWVLVLNPDVRVTRGFLSKLVGAGNADDRIGTVCGKLLGMTPDFRSPFETGTAAMLDSTGIYFTPELRHFDRGSRQLDRGQFDRAELVFGATGAAALYRRRMIDDVQTGGEFFDKDFFAYREDADVAWRAQLLGWRCLYTPSATAFHVRNVLPTNRKSVSAAVNYHSVKNRFLMRIKNIDAPLYRRYWFAITLRDALVAAGCLARERSSLPAFAYVLRNWRKTWAKRQIIMSRRKASPEYIAQWFSREPVSSALPRQGDLP